MKLVLTPGTASQIVHVFIQDSTATDGSGKTALVFGDITAYYVRAGGTLTALTMETIATLGTWASSGDNYLGFKLMHDTNAPGVYELHLPNNILTAGASQVTLLLRATGAAPLPLEIQLGNVPADALAISGDSTAADNLELDYDGTGYAKANSTIGTTTTNTDMRGTDSAATAAKLLAYVQLLARSDAAIETDNATELTEINANGGSGAGDYSAQTDGGEAIRDRGDTAWVTATSVTVSDKTGFSLANGSIAAATFAAGAITASVIADAAIDNATFAADVQSTAYGSNIIAQAVGKAVVNYGLDHLVSASVIGTDVADNSIIAKIVSSGATADWDGFVNTTDSLQAVRDRGDAAWVTATSVTVSDKTGFSLAANQSAVTIGTVSAATLANGAHGGAAASITLADYSNFQGAGGGDATASNQTTIINHLTGIKGGTWSGVTDSLEAIRDRGDSAWVTATSVTVSDKTGFSLASDQSAVTIGTVNTLTNHTAQTGDSFARLGAPAGASVSADVAAVKTDTGNLVSRITSTLFTGITSLAQWLGLIAGKQTGDTTARTELRATGVGSGTYDETADSNEAQRDRGDAAWTTATSVTVSDKTGFALASNGLASVTTWTVDITGTVSGNAVAGDAMTLAADAITASVFDETTAFPLASADSGSTQVARTGADSDTLETLSDQLDSVGTDRRLGRTVSYDGTTLKMGLWLEENGLRQTNATSCTNVEVWNAASASAAVVDLGDDSIDSADGIFYFSGAVTLVVNTPYYVKATITKGGTAYQLQAGLAYVS